MERKANNETQKSLSKVVINWLLRHMPNEDLWSLSKRTTDWVEKLYYYSYFKNNNN